MSPEFAHETKFRVEVYVPKFFDRPMTGRGLAAACVALALIAGAILFAPFTTKRS